MKLIGSLFFLLFLLFISFLSYRKHQENVRKKIENERKKKVQEAEQEAERLRQIEIKRKKLYAFFKTKINNIKTSNLEFAKLIALRSGYFTNFQMITWKNQQVKIISEIQGKLYNSIGLSNDEVEAIKTFQDNYKNSISIRNNFNKVFINEELKAYQSFFNNIEGRKLDLQQRTAVITDEDNNIVIAGAGSGKTTTIVGKIKYIIDRYKVKPEEILLISFTKESAKTLAKRINIEGVEAKTFHKFGKDIVVEIEGRQPSIFDEAQFKHLLTRYFTESISNYSFLQIVTEYFINFLKPSKSQFEFENQGGYIQYLKDQNFKSYKLIEVPTNGKITYKMEVVKSIEECRIANFLLFNNVSYEYEFPYEYDTATVKFKQYKPDFTVIQNGKKIYIEHFGISRSGNVPSWFSSDGERTASEKYRDDMIWKRETHKKNGTTLIESYSFENSEGILFANLTKNLIAAGIVLKPISPEEIWKIITVAAKDEINSFITLFETFITLMKSNNYSLNDVINRNKRISDKFNKERNALFLQIVKPIFERYENYLAERNEIDFSDMINKATKYISSGIHKQKYRYVIIDEFQDISIGRYQLVKAIKINNPACKLFCVGDDWQSIYRFSGSDIALFKDFEKYFGYSVKSRIETTYRFHHPLINLSSDFIQKNPNQSKKELKGTSNTKKTNYSITYSVTDNQDDTIALQNIFNHLLTTIVDIDKKEVLILGRYGFDIDRIKNENQVFSIDKTNELITYRIRTDEGQTKKLSAQFKTVHKAKGLEGDIIILLNCNSGKFGFPSEMSDDQVLNLLLSEADQFENGEERRLFYVAMTRAKESLYFVADTSYKSKFISELEIESGQAPNEKCPLCKTADVVLKKSGVSKNGDSYKYFGCTNYLYGCTFTKTVWTNN